MGYMINRENYTNENSKVVDSWVKNGWLWSIPVSHEAYLKAKEGEYDIVLTPTKSVPHEWFGPLKGKRVLALASGGGQQGPIFKALGADVTILDYSDMQLEREKEVAIREVYEIKLVKADMSKPLPFADSSFDLIFNPVSTCYIEKIEPLWKECYRILSKDGILLTGVDNGINYIVKDIDEREITHSLPFNPLEDPLLMEELMKDDAGIQFSHTLGEHLTALLNAGFKLTNIFEDTNGEGHLHELNIPTFAAIRVIKE